MKKSFEKKIFLACDLFGEFFGSLHGAALRARLRAYPACKLSRESGRDQTRVSDLVRTQPRQRNAASTSPLHAVP